MLDLKLIPGDFTECQVNQISDIPFDREHIFVNEQHFIRTIQLLSEAGYRFVS